MPPLETRTDSPGETPEVPQDPCQHRRGILSFRHQLHTRFWAPASTGEKFRCSRRCSRGGALPRKGERDSRVVPPFPVYPLCLSPFLGKLFSLHCLDFQAEDPLTQRRHVGQPCGKASWESLLGKPREKATDPLMHAKGSVTLLLQLGRKAHVHALTRDED